MENSSPAIALGAGAKFGTLPIAAIPWCVATRCCRVVPLDKRGAELLFQVISKRCEAASTIITTNIAYAQWSQIFAGDATLTSALLDQLLHHSETVFIESDSYRGPQTEVET